MPQTRGSFWNQLAVFWVLLLMFCFAFYGSAQPLFNNIVTVQANLDSAEVALPITVRRVDRWMSAPEQILTPVMAATAF
jgi:hypothetical protein